MYEFLVLSALALGLFVVLQALDELVGSRVPVALRSTAAITVGVGLAWMLGYSVFTAFGQDLRAAWMHPVMTGIALVAFGELIRSVVSAIANRAAQSTVDTPSSRRAPRAA